MYIWYECLKPRGLVIVIDDFLTSEYQSDEVTWFREAWMASSLTSVESFVKTASMFRLVDDVDVGKQYEVVKTNYSNRMPSNKGEKRKHQGWLGGRIRQRLYVSGKCNTTCLFFKNECGRCDIQYYPVVFYSHGGGHCVFPRRPIQEREECRLLCTFACHSNKIQSHESHDPITLQVPEMAMR